MRYSCVLNRSLICHAQVGETLCVYSGDICTGKQLDLLYGPDTCAYTLETQKEVYVDSAANRCWASLVNDSYNVHGAQNNLRWSVYHSSNGTVVMLKTKRPVAKGNEFFVSYGGRAYWSGNHGTFTLCADSL
jgi:hypothetical protein